MLNLSEAQQKGEASNVYFMVKKRKNYARGKITPKWV